MMAVIYYRIAAMETSTGSWGWISAPKTSLSEVYALCHFNALDSIDALVFGSQFSWKLNEYLINYVQGNSHTFHTTAKAILAHVPFNVELEENRLKSWVVEEAEAYLVETQSMWNLLDKDRLRRRLEFVKWMVHEGKLSEQVGDTT